MPQGKLTYRRGEIRWVKLDPTIGAEAQKTRACLIIQSDIINKYGYGYSSLLLALSNEYANARHNRMGNDRPSVIHQITTSLQKILRNHRCPRTRS